jgi:hypothetical protein
MESAGETVATGTRSRPSATEEQTMPGANFAVRPVGAGGQVGAGSDFDFQRIARLDPDRFKPAASRLV